MFRTAETCLSDMNPKAFSSVRCLFVKSGFAFTFKLFCVRIAKALAIRCRCSGLSEPPGRM